MIKKKLFKIPVLIYEENMFLHDPNNSYYNNFCSTKQLESGVDITLYDRKNEYNNNNLSLCERKCIYQGYNSNSKKVLCSCPMGNKSPLTLGDIIDLKKLLDSFINIKSKSNIGVMKCYKLLFSKEGIIYNIGSYLLLLNIFINIISFIYFVIKGKKSVYNEICNINLIKKEIIKLNKSDGNILKINKKNENKLEIIINDDKIY